MPHLATSQQQRLSDIIKVHPLVRANELRERGISAATISRAEVSGLITRVARGLYQGQHGHFETNQSLAEIAKKVPNGVIALTSSLAFHGLIDQMPRSVWIAIGKDKWAPKIDHPPVRYVRLMPKYLNQGIEHHLISGVQVAIYSVPKTLADMFRNPQLIDRSVAIEGLKAALASRKATPSEIYQAASTGGALKTMKPYLEALTSNG